MKKLIILFFVFFVCITSSFAQTRVFKDYNFNKGEYYILGAFAQSDENSLRDSLGEFYTNDIALLNEFKRTWVFYGSSPHYFCGYHYAIYVCKDGLVVETIYVNLNCNEIVTKNGDFPFDSKKLSRFIGRLEKPLSTEIKFNSLSAVREYRNDVLNNQRLIMTETPKWVDYEGYFDFTYVCTDDYKVCIDKNDSLINVMHENISNTYPNETFALSDVGGSMNEIDVHIDCSKTLSDKFNLYKRDTTSYFGKWKPYELSLKSYWIAR